MKRIALLLFVIICCAADLQAQPVLFINAGSRAAYGQQQELIIDNNGNCRYRLREVNGLIKDSSVFSISRVQLDSIFKKADEADFFSLNQKYTGDAKDGAGIYISLNSSGRKHSVQLVNTDQPAIHELIDLVNTLLAPQNIRINYGQFVIQRPR